MSLSMKIEFHSQNTELGKFLIKINACNTVESACNPLFSNLILLLHQSAQLRIFYILWFLKKIGGEWDCQTVVIKKNL